MGTDINLHIEVKINDTWHHYRHQNVARSYELFALMANVRNNGDIEPISLPKGLPSDVTFLTRYSFEEVDGEDGHSVSWLGPKEVELLIKTFFKENTYDAEDWFGYLFGGSWLGFLLYPNGRPEGLQSFRFVFWFDC